MRNFDTELDMQGATRRVVVSGATAVTVTERVPTANESKTYLMASGDDWTWEQLRDFVVTRIESLHGAFPRDLPKEAAIFKGFLSRWGSRAVPIARAAFDVYGGYWRSAPVSVGRFAKGSDPYFAEVIAANL